MERIVFPAAIILYFLIALILPTFRVWRRQRIWPVVFHRETGLFARVIGLLFGLFLLSLLFWSVLYWRLGPRAIGIWHAPGWIVPLGWFLMASGALITVAAQSRMGKSWRIGIDDRPTELVTVGLFSVCRNPIFSGMFMTLAGIVVVAPAFWSVLVAAITIFLVAVQTRLEEKHLIRLHGEKYLAYGRKVGRFVPMVGRFK